MQRNKGITLVALVITIILLLILSGITIKLTLGEHGILNMAKQAGQNYQNAAECEQVVISNSFNETQNIINDENNLQITPTGIATLKTKAKPGDYVAYDGGNKYEGLWRVLYNNETYGLQIISDTAVGKLTLGSTNAEETKKAYNDAVNTLNAYCEKYVNDSYAIFGRCLGSNPLDPKDKTTQYHTLLANYNGSKETGLKEASEDYKIDEEALTSFNKDWTSTAGSSGDWMACRRIEADLNNGSMLTLFFYRGGNPSSIVTNYMIRIYPQGNIFFPEEKQIVRSITGTVRPIITLFNSIETDDGDGSKNDPFKLVAQN